MLLYLPYPCISALSPASPSHLHSARLCQAQPRPSSSPRQPWRCPVCTPKQWQWQARPLRRSAADITAAPDSATAALPAQRGAPALPTAGAQAAFEKGPASALRNPASHHPGTSRHYWTCSSSSHTLLSLLLLLLHSQPAYRSASTLCWRVLMY